MPGEANTGYTYNLDRDLLTVTRPDQRQISMLFDETAADGRLYEVRVTDTSSSTDELALAGCGGSASSRDFDCARPSAARFSEAAQAYPGYVEHDSGVLGDRKQVRARDDSCTLTCFC